MRHEVEPKAGGWLLVMKRWDRRIVKIERLTKLHIVADGRKYRLDNGWEAGKYSHDGVATAISNEKAEELRNEWRMEREEREMRDRITELIKNADHATLTEIVELLDRMKEVVK